jgi:hypothetical protein
MKMIPRVCVTAALVLTMTACSKKAACPVCGEGIKSIKSVGYGKSDVPANVARCKGEPMHEFVITIVSDLSPMVKKEQ